MKSVAAVLFPVLVSIASMGSPKEAEVRPSIDLRVRNVARVDEAVMGRAQHMLLGIFANTGIRVNWTERPIDEAFTPLPSEVPVTIVKRASDISKANHWRSNALAVTLNPGGARYGSICVFYRSVETAADSIVTRWTSNADEARAVVLAYALAHEIGHVLLPNAKHSAHGVMSERLSGAEWEMALRGLLRFESAQEEAIARGIALRTEEMSIGQ